MQKTAISQGEYPSVHAHSGAALVYASALALLAVLTLVSHFIMGRVISRQQAATATIRVAGRQRTFSQRIARQAEELAYGTVSPGPGRSDLLALVDAMRLNQQHLLHGDPAADILAPDSQPLRDIYFSPDEHLAQTVDDFLAHARRFAASPTLTITNPDLVALRLSARAPLLDGLDRALQQYAIDAETDIHSLQRIMTLLTAGMLLTLLLEALFVYRPLFRRMSRAMTALGQASITDGLTGLLNRGALLQLAERDLIRARADGQPLCLIMADLDHFKQINDRYGHAAGDRILCEFAASLDLSLRRGDRAGRLGGEEFALVLPQSGIAGGRLVAERIRSHFAERAPAFLPSGADLRPTVSMGIVSSTGDRSIAALLAEADALLYRAKHQGRNRVVTGGEAGVSTVPETPVARLANDPA